MKPNFFVNPSPNTSPYDMVDLLNIVLACVAVDWAIRLVWFV